MKTKTLVLVALLFVPVSLSAQENETKETYTYSNITEFGFFTTNIDGVAIEATTVHGFAVDNKHHFGLGIGFGASTHIYYTSSYIPVFANYRLYFKPDQKRSPHVNASLGGLMIKDGGGVYSSLAMGFKAGGFSFSSGLSFMAINQKERGYYSFEHSDSQWSYPFGIIIKWGFTF